MAREKFVDRVPVMIYFERSELEAFDKYIEKYNETSDVHASRNDMIRLAVRQLTEAPVGF